MWRRSSDSAASRASFQCDRALREPAPMRDSGGMDELATERVLLRRWRPEDERAMAAINRDPEVSRYLNRRLDERGIEMFVGAMIAHWEEHGFGPWAVESLEPASRQRFLGFVGLAYVPPSLAAAGPAPELGWRLERSAWGRGLATEAAAVARDDALGRLGQAELISIIHPENARSQRVAEKIGFKRARTIKNPLLGREVDVWQLSAAGRRCR